ncbi:multidrug transporter EmrD [Vibrio anguillarum]|jgi:MFS transporter, DHA1 family, 2-module integral membrane pump EmrD|uniref:Multidrug transporter EmrD n=4 Tax=Vibrio TaxID=662 RepID=A0A241NKR4_VIBAN|nr:MULTISPECIES: multidrug efflux MFS transporter EmrD [Vibrio]AEH35112.1 Multidrug resistance protein D [Vibrio anguillarum 775]AQM21368.1 MFS transporter [Vibrio anguillarum]ASF93488.1 Bcr/CflA family drug resistance efflux transporter [Vibrio anguillarum]ASG05233.1 Bcr/CflA family drug resistance efflux transporter [Vibrio anguillarum]ASG08979.1 Bcr/CflA family drug resistance efflux transporter [Vibrio anguillarum]
MSASFPLVKLTFLIAILTAVGQMTQTMYVPSIGHMAGEFLVSPASLQAVMACYLIPYGLSQFVYGPLSDRLGRKPIIIAGLLIYIAGSLLALFAHQYDWFLVGSFIQGLGIGCGGAMSRTLTRDCFSGAELHKANSLISMCVIFSPLIAPVLGGYLTESFGWRSSYLFLSLFAIAVVITMMTSMVETLPKAARRHESVANSYRYVLSDKRFQGYLICLVATFSGVAVFEAAAGVLLGGVLQLPATTVSLLFVLPIPGYLVGAALSSVIALNFNEKSALYVGLVAIALGSLVVFVPGVLGQTSALTLIGGATVYFLGAGILFPAATTGALTPLPYHAGTGGAVLGGMQNLGAGLATLLASAIPAHDQMPLGALMLLMSVFAVVGLIRVYSKHDPSNEMPLAV